MTTSSSAARLRTTKRQDLMASIMAQAKVVANLQLVYEKAEFDLAENKNDVTQLAFNNSQVNLDYAESVLYYSRLELNPI